MTGRQIARRASEHRCTQLLDSRATVERCSDLSQLIRRAIAWAEARAAEIGSAGVPLTASGRSLARSVGVRSPELIRVSEVNEIRLPVDAALRRATFETGLLAADLVGLTLGYSIQLVIGQRSNQLLSHECRHVHQYECAGSIRAFLPVYLREIALHGYHCAPLEIDARRFELDGA